MVNKEKQMIDAMMAKFYKVLAAGATVTGDLSTSSYYVSFASPGIPISEQDLTFSPVATSLPQIEIASAFAALTNSIPPATGFWRYSSRMVWDEYNRILTSTSLPFSNLSASEITQLENAQSLLWTNETISNGNSVQTVRVETQLFKKYQENLSKYQDAQLEYNSHLLQVQSSPSDSALGAWWTQNEPLYRQKVMLAKQQWIAGGKDIVESAFATIEMLSSREPSREWSDYRTRFNQFLKLDSNGSPYYYTDYIPARFFDLNSSWTPFSFNSIEVEDTDLDTRSLWGGGAEEDFTFWKLGSTVRDFVHNQLTVETTKFSCELEFRRISLRRSWMVEEIFHSRAWRWANPHTELLSDGVIPPTGSLVAYPVELIVIRNLIITMEVSESINEEMMERIRRTATAGWGIFRLKGKSLLEELKPEINPNIIRELNTNLLKPQIDVLDLNTPTTSPNIPGLRPDLIKLRRDVKLRLTTGQPSIPIFYHRFPPPTAELPPRQPHTFTARRNTISAPGLQIIGFGCKLLPKSPNPDLTLQW